MKHTKSYLTVLSIIFIFLIVGTFIFWPSKEKKDESMARDWKEIYKSDTLYVVTELNSIGYFVSGDTLSGFNFELLKHLSKVSGINFKVSLENSLDKSFKALNENKYDLVARNIPINVKLKEEYFFTEPIVLNKLILVQRKAEFNNNIEPLRSHLELAKKTIHIPENAPEKFRLKNLSKEIGDTVYIKEDPLYESEQLAMMVSKGEIDYTICDITLVQKLSTVMPELDFKTDIGFTHLESWAVRKGSPELLDSLNLWLNQFKESKDFQTIYRKYYK